MNHGPGAVPAPTSCDYPDTLGWYSYDAPKLGYAQHYSYNTVYATPAHWPQYDGFDRVPRPPSSTERSARTPKAYRSTRDDFVSTERRKIIIKSLPSSIVYAEVWDLVRSKAGSEADSVLQVSLPTTTVALERATNRGYATVTFRSEEVAHKVLRRLNGHKVNGRSLKVEFTKEGVSRNEGFPSRPANSSSADPRVAATKSGHREEKAKPDILRPERSESIVIANGSSR
jgi:hypothetical protein